MDTTEQRAQIERIRAEENLLLDFQFALIDELNARKMSRADLAKAMGVSKARVTQLLSPDANPTIKIIAHALHVLEMSVEFVPANRKREKQVEMAKRSRNIEQRQFDFIELTDDRFGHLDCVWFRYESAANENGPHLRKAA